MFINAELRHVSNGYFESFVHRPHQRLVEMTSNDGTAWGGFRTVVPQVNDTWDEHLNVFGNQNYSVESPFGGYFPNTGPQSQGVDLSKPSHPVTQQSQYNHHKRAASQVHQQEAQNTDSFNQPGPMLGNDYSTYNMHGRSSFGEFSGTQNALKGFAYQPVMEPVMPTFSAMDSSGLLQTSYLDDGSGLGANMNMNTHMDKASPSTVVYSGRSTSSHSIDPRTLSQYGMSHSTSPTTFWWPETSRASNDRPLDHDVSTTNYNGSPRYSMISQPHQFNNSWTMPSDTSSTWPSHEVTSDSISPTALSLNISSTSFSMSGSSQESMLQISESSLSERSEDDQSNYSSPERLKVVEPQLRRPRQILPKSGPVSRRMLPILASNDTSPSRICRKRLSTNTNTSASNSRQKNTPLPGGDSLYYASVPRSGAHKRIEPKHVAPSEQCVHSLATVKPVHYRDAKDDFIVRSRMAGMSYKDIRKKGKFTEAESTLRGRFRTLTKHKAERVRKPEWNDNDILLLKRAVRKLTRGVDLSKRKVPWKLVAEYISDNGGSYHFGNATCRKRWDELQEES